MANKQNISKPVVNCYHCGDLCTTQNVSVGEKYFCCHGCKSVYELLNENELCDYYALNKFPGQVQKRESRKEREEKRREEEKGKRKRKRITLSLFL